MEKNLKSKLIPISFAVLVIILDQLSKFLIVKNVGYGEIGLSFLGDFFRIVHISNTGVAFSVGANWSNLPRFILFCIVPLVVIIAGFIFYFKSNDFAPIHRWALMGIAGGGLGNLIDRFFRSEGVVDFIDVKVFGLFGRDRWPTFNIADSFIVVCGILFLISVIVLAAKEKKSKEEN